MPDVPPGYPQLLGNQCLEPQVLEHLRALGFDIVPLVELTGTGDLDDAAVLGVARWHGRAVLTYDKNACDFDALDNSDSPGLLVVRDIGLDFERIARRVALALDAVGRDAIAGAVVVIEPGRVRLRNSAGRTIVRRFDEAPA